MRTIPRASIGVPASIARGDRAGRSPVSIRPSTISSLVPTSGADGFSPASSPNRMVAEESRCCHASRAWIATPSPEADANCTKGTRSRWAACGGREPDGPGGVAAGHYSRGPHLRHEVDAPLAPQPPQGPPTAGDHGIGPDHRSAVARAAILVADVPQAQGGDPRPEPGPAVPLPDAAAEPVPDAGMAGDQRRYQEEGVGG